MFGMPSEISTQNRLHWINSCVNLCAWQQVQALGALLAIMQKVFTIKSFFALSAKQVSIWIPIDHENLCGLLLQEKLSSISHEEYPNACPHEEYTSVKSIGEVCLAG